MFSATGRASSTWNILGCLLYTSCAAVAFPDFTRGEWNVVKGYKHAYATPEEEAAAMEKAKAFTAKLKEQGAKEWAEK